MSFRYQDVFVHDSCSLHDVFEDDYFDFFPQFSRVNSLLSRVDSLRVELPTIIEKVEKKDEDLDTLKMNSSTNCDKIKSISISKKIVKPQKEKKSKESLSKQQPEQKKEAYMLPGESKNIPKNFTRALKSFIHNNFDSSVLQNPEIKKLLATKPEKACKQTLENSINSCQLLKQISQVFFGNLSWGTLFLEENKVELEPYFRFNQIWFRSKD